MVRPAMQQATQSDERSGSKSKGANASSLISEHNMISSPVDASCRELVIAEETLWKRLADAKLNEDTHDGDLALKAVYTDLAQHYVTFGGSSAAILFLKNALSKGLDEQLQHQLARLEATIPGVDFIATFTELRKGRAYDLKLTLEYCYFLENRGLHCAALNILETELSRRPEVSPEESTEHISKILHDFLYLLQANINIQRQLEIQDYRELFAANFPDAIFPYRDDKEDVPEATIVGLTIEEFERDHGVAEELKRAATFFSFAARHYTIPLLTATGGFLLVTMSLLRVDTAYIQFTGTVLLLFLGIFFLIALFNAARMSQVRRLREQNKIARNISIVSVTLLALNWIGPRIFGDSHSSYIPMLAAKIMSCILVGAMLWKTYLNLATLRESLTRIHSHVVALLDRTMFRRETAAIVRTSSGWFFLIGLSSALQIIRTASPTVAFFAFTQMLFFSMTWAWGRFEAEARKQKLRDQLALLSSALFIAMLGIEVTQDVPPWLVVTSASVDGTILILMSFCYMLQVSTFSSKIVLSFITPFLFLNFAPILEEVGVFSKLDEYFAQYIPTATVGGRVIIVMAMVVMIPLLWRRRRIVQQAHINGDYYMNSSKYQVHAGQVGAIGDNNTVTDAEFFQTNTAASVAIDLQALVLELSILRESLITRANTPEHFVAIAEVAAAEQAATNGDREGTLSSLKKAGAWMWDTASKIGIGVATAAVKQQLGV